MKILNLATFPPIKSNINENPLTFLNEIKQNIPTKRPGNTRQNRNSYALIFTLFEGLEESGEFHPDCEIASLQKTLKIFDENLTEITSFKMNNRHYHCFKKKDGKQILYIFFCPQLFKTHIKAKKKKFSKSQKERK